MVIIMYAKIITSIPSHSAFLTYSPLPSVEIMARTIDLSYTRQSCWTEMNKSNIYQKSDIFERHFFCSFLLPPALPSVFEHIHRSFHRETATLDIRPWRRIFLERNHIF